MIKNAQDAVVTAKEQEMIDGLADYTKCFDEAMEDDFNTADAISVIFELVKYINVNILNTNNKTTLEEFNKELIKLSDICGLILTQKDDILDSEIEQLIADRQTARKEKNFARADEIRDELLNKGIILEDTREGVKWKRA